MIDTRRAHRGPIPTMIDPEKAPKNLLKALLAAIVAVEPVHSDARNKEQGFDYASSDLILEVGKSALSGSGLVLLPAGYLIDEAEAFDRDDGTVGYLTRFVILVHVETCEMYPLSTPEWPIVLRDGLPRDKALAVALTKSLRYLYRDLLSISVVGKDEEANEFDDRGFRTKPAPMVSHPELQGIADELWALVENRGLPQTFEQRVAKRLTHMTRVGRVRESDLALLRLQIEKEHAKAKVGQPWPDTNGNDPQEVRGETPAPGGSRPDESFPDDDPKPAPTGEALKAGAPS